MERTSSEISSNTKSVSGSACLCCGVYVLIERLHACFVLCSVSASPCVCMCMYVCVHVCVSGRV